MAVRHTLRSPLHERHVALGARIVAFAGWDISLQYSGIIAEHLAVRRAWGVFDVSHMGRLAVEGKGAAALLDSLMTVDIAGLEVGQARYGFICMSDGGILDDVVTLRRDDTSFLVICNASNRAAVIPHLHQHLPSVNPPRIEDLTPSTVMLAAQGPEALEKVNDLFGSVPALRRFRGAPVSWLGDAVLVTRTGYTGEDGYELIAGAATGKLLWEHLMKAGATPCGLGSRDTLRLEAGLPLHGQDIDTTTNPIEAGLDRFVQKGEREFAGKWALERVARNGPVRRLIGYKTSGRSAVPRHGQAIIQGERQVGTVTSGNYSPSLEVGIGLGYVLPEVTRPGDSLHVDVRGRLVEVEVSSLPFYRRS